MNNLLTAGKNCRVVGIIFPLQIYGATQGRDREWLNDPRRGAEVTIFRLDGAWIRRPYQPGVREADR